MVFPSPLFIATAALIGYVGPRALKAAERALQRLSQSRSGPPGEPRLMGALKRCPTCRVHVAATARPCGRADCPQPAAG